MGRNAHPMLPTARALCSGGSCNRSNFFRLAESNLSLHSQASSGKAMYSRWSRLFNVSDQSGASTPRMSFSVTPLINVAGTPGVSCLEVDITGPILPECGGRLVLHIQVGFIRRRHDNLGALVYRLHCQAQSIFQCCVMELGRSGAWAISSPTTCLPSAATMDSHWLTKLM